MINRGIRQMNNAQLVIDEVKKAVKGKDDCIRIIKVL